MKRWHVRRGPHGVDISVVVLGWVLRGMLLGTIVLGAAWAASWGQRLDFGVPFVTFRPTVTDQLLRDHWCADGQLLQGLPAPLCLTDHWNTRGRDDLGVWYQHQVGFPRLSRSAHLEPHPFSGGLLILGLAVYAYRKTRPIDLKIRPNGVAINGRFVHRDQLRGCEVRNWIWLPVIVIHLEDGPWTSSPLGLDGWRVESLIGDIRALVPTPAEVTEAKAAKRRISDEAQALLARTWSKTGLGRNDGTTGIFGGHIGT
jgi:hypothetical protein